MNWTIVIPFKALPAAKARLASASPDPQSHAQLVDAIRADTLAVAGALGRVIVVVDRVGEDEPAAVGDGLVVVQDGTGLNQALRQGAAVAGDRWPDDAIAALVGDLPALTVGELEAALTAAARFDRAYVADTAGTGTTLLTVRPGVELRPAFGPSSAARHNRIARLLTSVGPGLRLDVDTADDLDQARELGVGPKTRAALG